MPLGVILTVTFIKLFYYMSNLFRRFKLGGIN